MDAWHRPKEDGHVPRQKGVAAAERDLAVPAPMRHAHNRSWYLEWGGYKHRDHPCESLCHCV